MSKRAKIIRAFKNYPNLNKTQIAKRVGCTVGYVNTVENKYLRSQPKKSEEVEQVSVPTSDTIDAGPNPYVPDLYHDLAAVLEAAYNQAAHGKGKERHADANPLTEQPIFKIAEQVGDGFNAGQVIKKTQEARQMAARGEYAKAQHEILGAIVYAASLHVMWGNTK